jgi:hypothetical protein
MESYIITDLIKYVISDYVIYDILACINNGCAIINNKDRTTVINTLANTNIVTDNCIRKSMRYDGVYLAEITNYNTACQKHGYKLYYDADENLTCKQLYIKDNLKKEIIYNIPFSLTDEIDDIKSITYFF